MIQLLVYTLLMMIIGTGLEQCAMAQSTRFPQFYTDKNRYFSFIPPLEWEGRKEFPDDPRSKVAFTHVDPDTGNEAALVIICYQVDNPRPVRSLKKFLENRLSLLRKETGAIVSPLETMNVAGTECITANVFMNDTKTKIILGYPYGTLCLDITYTASVFIYEKYHQDILDSLQTFIPLKGAFERDEDIVAAQNKIWLKKEALFLLSDKKYARAAELLEPLAADNDNDSNLHFQLGVAYQGLQRPDDAIRELTTAAKLNPQFWEAYFQMGVIYYNLENFIQAEEMFLAAREINPESYEVNINLASAYRHSGKAKKAIIEYNRLLDLNPSNVSVLFNMGMAYLQLNNVERAIQCYEKALYIEPDNTAVMVNLAACHYAQKDYLKAQRLCDNALVIDPAIQKAQELRKQIEEALSR